MEPEVTGQEDGKAQSWEMMEKTSTRPQGLEVWVGFQLCTQDFPTVRAPTAGVSGVQDSSRGEVSFAKRMCPPQPPGANTKASMTHFPLPSSCHPPPPIF